MKRRIRLADRSEPRYAAGRRGLAAGACCSCSKRAGGPIVLPRSTRTLRGRAS